ncbi:MAG TPA: SCO family protein [Candidatus Kapabacteria bacterium]|nr:SCO family protein [Candidatus Kapabacteria bacterium]
MMTQRYRWCARASWAMALLFVMQWLAPGGLRAQPNLMAPRPDNSTEVVNRVGIDQRLNGQVPLDLQFTDETGRKVQLSEYVNTKPVVLVLAYYQCPMLCSEVLNGLVKSMRVLNFDAGKEFNVLTVSINPKETPQLAAEKKANYIRNYGRPGTENGWHFLTGEQSQIDALCNAAGFRYVYDPNTEQYAHAGGIMVLTPTGRLSRYLLGVEFSPNDLKFSLMEASANKIGTPVDQLLLLCYHYDPTTGKYGFAIMTVLRIAGILTVGAIALFWYRTIKADRRKREAAQTPAGGPGPGAGA